MTDNTYNKMKAIAEDCASLNIPIPSKVRKYLAENDAHPLETEFRRVFLEFGPRIQEQVTIAEEALQKAYELSEESGIPFTTNVIEGKDVHKPGAYSQKFAQLDRPFFEELTGIYDLDEQSDGWYSSSC